MKRILIVLVVTPLAAPAENWPSWRGPTGQGISTEKNLPVTWSPTKNVVWKVPLKGAGVSTPIIWEDHIFLTASDDRRNDRLHVFCYQRATGKQLWHTRLFGTAPTNLYPPGGMAVPTPVTDGKFVYCVFGTGDIACLDFAGRPLWLRSLAQEYGPFRNRWGMASSPVLVGKQLVLQVDHWGQSYLLALDTATGKNRWKTNRAAHVNWTTPLVMKITGQTQIITVGTGVIQAYDAKSGHAAWRVDGINDQCVPSPIQHGDTIVVGSDRNSMAISIESIKENSAVIGFAWKNKRDKAYLATPLIYQGCMYLAGKNGIVTCLDAKTGKRLWKERLGGQFQASPVGGDGKVYFTSKDGTVYVLRAGRTFAFLARNEMRELIVASPAVSHGQMFFRGATHLFCIGGP